MIYFCEPSWVYFTIFLRRQCLLTLMVSAEAYLSFTRRLVCVITAPAKQPQNILFQNPTRRKSIILYTVEMPPRYKHKHTPLGFWVTCYCLCLMPLRECECHCFVDGPLFWNVCLGCETAALIFNNNTRRALSRVSSLIVCCQVTSFFHACLILDLAGGIGVFLEFLPHAHLLNLFRDK